MASIAAVAAPVVAAVAPVAASPCLSSRTSGAVSVVPRRHSMAGRTLSAPAAVSARTVMSAQAPKEQKSLAEQMTVPATLALVALTVLPDMALAANGQPGVSPSLKNLLYSVLGGGVVLTVIAVGIYGVASFDPVNRRR